MGYFARLDEKAPLLTDVATGELLFLLVQEK